jgi:antitoxin CptB
LNASTSAPTFGQLRWHCRRGMKELDELLMRWLEQHYGQQSSAYQQLFREFLELPDPLMAAYLLGREQSDNPDQQALIEQIRHRAL